MPASLLRGMETRRGDTARGGDLMIEPIMKDLQLKEFFLFSKCVEAGRDGDIPPIDGGQLTTT